MTVAAPLPPGLMSSLAQSDAPRALLLRHGDRYPIPDGDPGTETPLTTVGKDRARALGSALGGPLAWAVSSPLVRCTQTAELIGATPTPSRHLGDPGPFVIDSSLGAAVFGKMGTREVVYAQIRGATLGCMRPLEEGARLALRLLRNQIGSSVGTGVAISHDAIVVPFIAWATGYAFEDDWLGPLDGIVVCEDAVVWRGERFEVPR